MSADANLIVMQDFKFFISVMSIKTRITLFIRQDTDEGI